MLDELLAIIACLIFLLLLYGFPIGFFFLLVITAAMRDRDTKLKFREIMQCAFRKLF